MSRRARLGLFALAGPGLAAVLVIGFTGLPAFGDYHGVYGLVASGVLLGERHATDLVTSLNFDTRAFDTLGEEFILFTSVLGVVLILRELRDEGEEAHTPAQRQSLAESSAAVRALAPALAGMLVALGFYVVIHGALTPGGGFQGGIVLAAGLLTLVAAGLYLASKTIAPTWALEALDSLGAAGYALVGVGGLIFASRFLENFLPLGIPGHLLSAGMMPLNSIAVGLEVTGAFLLVWFEFLDQALLIRRNPPS
jgi:multicomponent Na+:H+ antiporter subunit B